MPLTALKTVVDALRGKYSASEFESWDSKKEDWFELLSQKLRELSAFRSMHQVGLRTYATDATDDRVLEELWKLCDTRCRAGGILSMALAEAAPSERHGRDWYHDFSFTAGYGSDGYYIALSISNESRFWRDAHRRSELFHKAITLLGLEGQISIESYDGNFTLRAQPPLRLRFRHVRPGNRNPTELDVVGLSSLQDTIERTRAARDGLSVRTLETSFACTLSPEQYGAVRGSLNVLQCGWHVDVLGTLSRSAEDVLNGSEFTDKTPEWIPAFRWHEDNANAKVLGAIVIENGQRYLEIATDGGTLELLHERVAFLQDLRFEPVYP